MTSSWNSTKSYASRSAKNWHGHVTVHQFSVSPQKWNDDSTASTGMNSTAIRQRCLIVMTDQNPCFSFIHFGHEASVVRTIIGARCFQFTHFPCDDLENIYTLSYYHDHQIGSMNYYHYHFVYAPSQWETMLHFNVVSYWLGAYTKWSLLFLSQCGPYKSDFVPK